MKILFLIGTLISALLLTLPPFLCRQTESFTDEGQVVLRETTEPSVPDRTENALDELPQSEPVTDAVCPIQSTTAEPQESASEQQSTETAVSTETVMSAASAAADAPEQETSALPDTALETDGYDSRVLLTVTGEDRQYTQSLRSFLIGVVMAEMPSYFHEEALRAQAIAARSYLLYRQERGFYIYDYGSSSTAHFTEAEGRAFFGVHYDGVLASVTAAVDDTDGQVLYYGGRVCCAAYHAMSYQSTEDASNVWGGDTPYLTAVTTPEPASLAGMTTEAVFDEESLCRLLGVEAALPLTLSFTAAGRVSAAVTASGDTVDGETLRACLRLRSTAITVIQQNENTVQLCIRGFGHGVGMSQYGADLYADAGWSYEQILSHYYPGTTLGLLS